VLADAAHLQPIVLGIDDAHWLDDGSALFLRNLALRPVPGLSLLVAARPEGERTPALVSRMLGDLRRLDDQATHDIGPLSPTAISELGQLLGRPLADVEVTRLADSGGNALVVRELVVHSPDLIEIPDEVSSFFEQRLAELPSLARRVLSTAALLPEPIDVGLLAEVVGEQADVVISELDRSVRADLLVGTPVNGLRFRHSLVRDAVAETIAEGDRSRVRTDAAGVLRRTSVDSKIVAELLLSASSVPEPAAVVDACRRAGEVSVAELAHEDAARFFGQALARLDPTADTAERLALTMRRAESLSAAWQWGEALPLFEAAADLARARGDAVVEADAVIRACGPPENYSWGDPTPAGLERVLEHLGELDGDRAAVLLASKAIGEWDEGRVGEAQDLLRRARTLASSTSAVSHVMRAHLRSWFDPVQVEERCLLADDLVELGVASSDLEIRAYGHRWAAITRFDAGDLERVEQHLDALAYVAERQRNLWHHWFVLTRRVTLETARGRLDAADVALTASSELARILETPYVRSSQASADLLVSWLRGRDVPGDVRAASDSSLFVRMALALTGDAIDTSLARGALGILPARSLAGRSVAVLAAPLALAGEDPELARLTIEALSEYEDGVAVVAPGAAFLGSVRQRRGYCHLALDSPESALADFSAAAHHEREIGAVGCAVRSEWLAGHALRILGDRAAAAERQERARVAAARMGIRCLSDVPLPGSQLDSSFD
jgi:tetratricopeptide (TPR) repeat protein